jgi:hypothetical protein
VCPPCWSCCLTPGVRAQDNGPRWAHERPAPSPNPRWRDCAGDSGAVVERAQASQAVHAKQRRAALADRLVEVNSLGGPPPLAGGRENPAQYRQTPFETVMQKLGGLARRDRKWSLNDGQIANPNASRVALGTGYHRVKGNRRASRNGPVSDLHPKPLKSRFATFASLYATEGGRVAPPPATLWAVAALSAKRKQRLEAAEAAALHKHVERTRAKTAGGGGGYNRVEGNRRASRNGRVSDLPPTRDPFRYDSQLFPPLYAARAARSSD